MKLTCVRALILSPSLSLCLFIKQRNHFKNNTNFSQVQVQCPYQITRFTSNVCIYALLNKQFHILEECFTAQCDTTRTTLFNLQSTQSKLCYSALGYNRTGIQNSGPSHLEKTNRCNCSWPPKFVLAKANRGGEKTPSDCF